MLLKMAALALATFSAAAPIAPASKAPTVGDIAEAQLDAVDAVLALAPEADIDVSISWTLCGEPNGFYTPTATGGEIALCLESNVDPGDAVFTAAHEAGHAVALQLDLPVDNSPWADEAAADELGALGLLEAGDVDDVMAEAMWYEQHAQPAIPGDTHPPDNERAFRLMCLADGADHGSPVCRLLYHAISAKWHAAIDAATSPE